MRRPTEGKGHHFAVLLMSLTVVAWGLSIISTKIVLSQIPPVTIAFFRYSIATAALVPLAFITHSLHKVTIKDLAAIIITSLLGIVFYFIFENNALVYTTASNASMLVAAMPMFTLIIEAIFFRQRVSWKMFVCILISMIGVYLVVTGDGSLDFSSSRFYGNMLMLGAMICWVVYTFLNRNLGEKYSGTAVITYQSLASVFLFVPFVLPEISKWPKLVSINLAILGNLIFLGVFCSALEYLCYVYSVKRLGSTVSMTFLNLIPVVTVISSFVLIQETLLPMELLGMGIIMGSIYGLNKVTIGSKASSDKEKKAQQLVAVVHKGKRSSHVYLRAILSFFRL